MVANPFNGSQYRYDGTLNYYKPAPVETGMTISDAVTNLNNLVHYSNAITGADGRKPTGGKYFWATGGKCDKVNYKTVKKTDPDTNPNDPECGEWAKAGDDINFNQNCKIIEQREAVDRYGYIDNAIAGPSLTAGSIGGGLLSGALGNIADINGSGLISSIIGNANPICREVSLEVVDKNGVVGSGTFSVTNNDIAQINPCNFTTSSIQQGGINVITGSTCMSGFKNLNDDDDTVLENNIVNMPNSKIDKLYLTSITLLLFYLLYKLGKCRS